MAKQPDESHFARTERIRHLTIVAMVSDDALFERLVLKGGNAVGLLGMLQLRRSLDLDFSLDGDLSELGSREQLEDRFRRALLDTFAEENLQVFDVTLKQIPPEDKPDGVGDFWGGYQLEFKVMDQGSYATLDSQRRPARAIEVTPGGGRKFRVDLSRHEYCDGKQLQQLDGWGVYVYTPPMIVCEKIRAICQQMPEYCEQMGRRPRPRARDFFDIHYIAANGGFDIDERSFGALLGAIFNAKRVPLWLASRISEQREIHRDDFTSVRSTIEPSIQIRDFDFYVDDLVARLTPLQASGVIQPPPL